MTRLLERAIETVSRLDADEQDAVARLMLRASEVDSGKQVDAETVRSLLGVFDGPNDLSTNRAYLDDLGERSMK